MTTSKVLWIAQGRINGILTNDTQERIQASAETVNRIVDKGNVVYGINTGFGSLCNTLISKEDTKILQHNILRSHAVGVGKPIPKQISKLMLILKIHALAKGFSGVRPETIHRMIWMVEEDLIPVVPKQGSVGASGDLAPLAHLFLPLIGLGQIWRDDQPVDSAIIFSSFSKQPLELGPKEGLALINGTQFILAHAVMVVDRMYNCLNHADIIGTMMIEALMGSRKPFAPELHALRPFRGNLHSANRVFHLLEGSEILKSHLACHRVQDPYSLRCIPQVHGSSRDAWLHLKEKVEIELNAVTDNPIIFSEEHTISGGNFHGQPLALPLDYAALAASELGNISDRRIYLSLEGTVDGLPMLLMKNTGINSGFMLCQYTSAALVSENKSLVYPASADSIPTSLGQEDHVSMGSISGRKALAIIDNLEIVLAIEMLCAAQAFDFRRPMRSSKVLEACHQHIRKIIDHADADRTFALDIEKSRQIIQSKDLLHILKKEESNNENFRTPHYDTFEVY